VDVLLKPERMLHGEELVIYREAIIVKLKGVRYQEIMNFQFHLDICSIFLKNKIISVQFLE